MTLQLFDERSGFSRLDESVTTRYATPKYWQVENFKIPNGTAGTKNGIDNEPGYNCLMLGVWNDRGGNQEGSLADARIYRRLHLEAGTYTMQAQYQTCHQMNPSAYMFASNVLSTTRTIPRKALASIAINKAGANIGEWQQITFSINEPQDIYVGWQANLKEGSENQEFRVKSVRLLYEPQSGGGDGIIDIKSVPTSKVSRYYNLKGQQLSEAPEHGLYIENGRKVLK